MSQETYGMGGSIVSYQQQRIDHDLEEFEQSLRHKPRKKKRRKQQERSENRMNELAESGDNNLNYTVLLNRIYSQLHPNENVICIKVPSPIVGLIGSKRTCFANIQQICHTLKRDPNHLKKFIETELLTTTNFNGSRQLILSGRWNVKHITSVIRTYINSYILCKNCSSLDTMINRNNSTRLFELQCNKCQSQRCCKRIEKALKVIANKQQRIEQQKQKQQQQHHQ